MSHELRWVKVTRGVTAAGLLVSLFALPVRVSAGDFNGIVLVGNPVKVIESDPPVIQLATWAHGVEQTISAVCGPGADCLEMIDRDPGPGKEMVPIVLGDCPYVHTGLPDEPMFWVCTVDKNNDQTYGRCSLLGGWLRDDGNYFYASLYGLIEAEDCTPKMK